MSVTKLTRSIVADEQAQRWLLRGQGTIRIGEHLFDGRLYPDFGRKQPRTLAAIPVSIRVTPCWTFFKRVLRSFTKSGLAKYRAGQELLVVVQRLF
jgi:hypothetical protein